MTPFEIETHAGPPVHAGQSRIIPFVQTIRLNLPGTGGGLAWSRPTAILTQTPDGQETVLPIQDVTRQAQITFLGLGILGVLLIWFFNRKNK